MQKNSEILDKINYIAGLQSRFVSILAEMSKNIDDIASRLERIEAEMNNQQFGSYPSYGVSVVE